eukprot:COSAG02_NODE_1527_length_12090_cov_4.316070_9_plen_72_part_00
MEQLLRMAQGMGVAEWKCHIAMEEAGGDVQVRPFPYSIGCEQWSPRFFPPPYSWLGSAAQRTPSPARCRRG